MRIERHVFGSYKGYTTLAKSAGISAEDARQLEGGVYGFGQTEDPRYAKSLRTRAAFFTRVLAGERRGLTRVLEGARDSDGRPTNLMITAVVSCSDWDAKLFGDVSQMLADKKIWQWAGGSEIAAVDGKYLSPLSTISRKSVLKVAALVSEIERRWNAPVPIIVSETEFGGEEIRAVEMLVPPRNRPQFTSACRSLGPQLAVTLNQLAAEAPLQKVNVHFEAQSAGSPYTEFLLENGLADGELPISEVIVYRTFGRTEPEKLARKRRYVPPPMPVEKEGWGILWIAVMILVILVIAAGYIVENEKSAKSIAVNPPPATAPAAVSAAVRDIPAPSEIDVARTAIDSAANTNPPQATPPSTQIMEAPVAASNPVVAAPTATESGQDRDLEQLQSHWDDFLILINQKMLTFVGPQGEALDNLESEMRRDGLVKRIEMGATGNIAALPVLLAVREQYFQVNSLLSDPHMKNPRGLAQAEQRLEASTRQAKVILNPVSSEQANNSRFFFKVDRTIRNARQRLKEMEAGTAP